jgi:hypothetical protein
MTSTRRRLCLTASAGLLAILAVAGATTPAGASTRPVATVRAATPCSPDGICDNRLHGTTNFSVYDGTYDHRFTFLGGRNEQEKWHEEVWLWGWIYVATYEFWV